MKIRLTNGKTITVAGRTETILLDDNDNRIGAVSDRHGNLYTVADRDGDGAIWEKAKAY